jgi:hypothetical protein
MSVQLMNGLKSVLNQFSLFGMTRSAKIHANWGTRTCGLFAGPEKPLFLSLLDVRLSACNTGITCVGKCGKDVEYFAYFWPLIPFTVLT